MVNAYQCGSGALSMLYGLFADRADGAAGGRGRPPLRYRIFTFINHIAFLQSPTAMPGASPRPTLVRPNHIGSVVYSQFGRERRPRRSACGHPDYLLQGYGLCLLNIAAHRRARRHCVPTNLVFHADIRHESRAAPHRRARRPRRAADYHPREILSSSSKSVPAPCRHILRSDVAAEGKPRRWRGGRSRSPAPTVQDFYYYQPYYIVQMAGAYTRRAEVVAPYGTGCYFYIHQPYHNARSAIHLTQAKIHAADATIHCGTQRRPTLTCSRIPSWTRTRCLLLSGGRRALFPAARARRRAFPWSAHRRARGRLRRLDGCAPK